MNGIDLWIGEGFEFWDIAEAASWDILGALLAFGWVVFIGLTAMQSLWTDRECDWKERLKVILFATSLLFPLLRLIYLVCEIWILK